MESMSRKDMLDEIKLYSRRADRAAVEYNFEQEAEYRDYLNAMRRTMLEEEKLHRSDNKGK